ncbi:MAG: hypothetical protein M3155_07895 [Actinomycetota bacterium]|nr:hypothetical protein [Actinomycetota bacterium]
MPFALAGGSWVLLLFVIVLFAVVVYGYFTRIGSGGPQRDPLHRAGRARDVEHGR